MPQIQLLDGKKIPFTKSISGFELSKKIGKSLEKSALIIYLTIFYTLLKLNHTLLQHHIFS